MRPRRRPRRRAVGQVAHNGGGHSHHGHRGPDAEVPQLLPSLRRLAGQGAQQRAVRNYGRVFHDVRRRGRDLHELAQILLRAVFLVDAPDLQLAEHGHGVYRPPEGEHREHRLEYLAVSLYIEVRRLHFSNDLGYAVWVYEHGAQDRLLGLRGMRRTPPQQLIHRRGLPSLFFLRYQYVYRARDLVAELGLDLVAAELLYGLGLDYLVLLDLDAVLLAQGLGYLLAGDGAEEAAALADVQTSKVSRENPVKTVRLYGKIAPNEQSLQSQTAHVGGRIEQLNINFTGESVRAGQTLAVLYSPELFTAQQELLEAIKMKQPALI